MRHLMTLFDLSRDEIQQIFAIAAEMKYESSQGLREPKLPRQVLGLLFEKQSLRTRVSFETAIAHCGGSSIYLGQDVGWGKRESVADFGRVISQYIDALVFRGKRHEQMVELASYCDCPVINGLTDVAHPCQALADLFTVQELVGDVSGKAIAYIGDSNNVCRSLATACGLLDVQLKVAAPKGYELDAGFLAQLGEVCPRARISQTCDPVEAVTGADVIYTDVWVSMGQETEKADRLECFAKYQVNAELFSKASPDAAFMHCLPAHRGEEVTDDVIDSRQSVVVQQAANRMHVQKAVLVWLLS